MRVIGNYFFLPVMTERPFKFPKHFYKPSKSTKSFRGLRGYFQKYIEDNQSFIILHSIDIALNFLDFYYYYYYLRAVFSQQSTSKSVFKKYHKEVFFFKKSTQNLRICISIFKNLNKKQYDKRFNKFHYYYLHSYYIKFT